MAPQGSRWQRRIEAAESAVRLLDEMEVDQTQQVDVFGMCEDLDLWLAFLPLDNLLGAFVPEGAGGVLVTTQRPVPIQRYTAAHELAHWRLDHGHGVALDGEEHVLGASPIEREQLAQVFAASLLMPPPLVFGTLERLGTDGSDLVPEDAYAVAREAGVSYEAAVRHLEHLDVITSARRLALLDRRPLSVKADLALGRRPIYGHADVWPVNDAWNGELLTLRVADEVVISLPENRSSGYRWTAESHQVRESAGPPPLRLEPPPIDSSSVALLRDRLASVESRRAPESVIERLNDLPARPAQKIAGLGEAEVVGDQYVPAITTGIAGRSIRARRVERLRSAESYESSGDITVGATGQRVIGVRFTRPGPTTVRLVYRPLFADEPPLREYVLRALVEPRRTGFSVDQLVHDTDEPWADPVRRRQASDAPLPPDSRSDDR